MRQESQVTIRVRQFRISLIWTEAFPFLVDGVTPVAADRAFLGRSSQYIKRFEEEQQRIRQVRYQRDALPPAIHVPWPQPWGQRFWMHYLGGTPPGRVSGAVAWNALIPFREKTADAVKARWLAGLGSVYHETFLYPHGLGFVLTVVVRAARPLELEDVVRRAFDIRRDRRFTVSLRGQVTTLVSERLAEAVLAAARSSILAGGQAPSGRIPEPFTVFTAISAEGADATKPPPNPVSNALDAIARWRRGWDPKTAFELTDENRLAGLASSAGNIVYASRRGRAVWFPRLFKAGREQHALGCYHRNLTLLSLQVDSLSGLVCLATRAVRAREDIPVRLHECVANAVRLLEDLRDGHASTYQSRSPPHQLEHNDVLDEMRVVSEFLW
jgi:hypothetical protein